MLVGAFGLGFIALVFISVTGSKKGHSAKRPPRIQLEPTPKAKSESSNPDAAIRLAKLKQLMGDGLITDEEYQRQRSKIVDSL